MYQLLKEPDSQAARHKEELHSLKLIGEALKIFHLGNRENIKSEETQTLSDIKIQEKQKGPLSKGASVQPKPKATGPYVRVGGSETDTVPTLLTPGEAVIPEPAAQNPNNKPIIEALIHEGRQKNAMQGMADGGVVGDDELRRQAEKRQAEWAARGATNIPSVEELMSMQRLMDPAYANQVALAGGVPEGYVPPPKGFGQAGTNINLMAPAGAQTVAVPLKESAGGGRGFVNPSVVPAMRPDKALRDARGQAMRDLYTSQDPKETSVGQWNQNVQAIAQENQVPHLERPNPPGSVTPPVTPIDPTINIQSTPVTTVEVRPGETGSQSEKVMKEFEKTAASPQVLSQMNILAEEVKNNPNADQGWLAKRLTEVWGPTGLFRDEDLGRFALVAAGGMLFGGSPLGSLRFAAQDAMKVADNRRLTEAQIKQQESTQAKATREGQRRDVVNRTQAQEDQYKVLQGQIMDPARRSAAESLYEKAREAGNKGDWQLKEAYLDQANRTLAGTVGDQKMQALIAKAEGKSSKPDGRDQYRDAQGGLMWGEWRGDQFFRRDERTGQWEPHVGEVMKATEYDKAKKDTEGAIQSGVADALQTFKSRTGDKNFSSEALKAKADAIRDRILLTAQEEGMNLIKNPKVAGDITRNTVQSILESGKRLEDLGPDYVNSVMNSQIIAYTAPSRLDEFFKVSDTNSTRKGAKKSVSSEAYVAFGEAMAEAKAQSGGKVSEDVIYKEMAKAYDALPPAQKARLAEDRRALLQGWSPFIIWATDRRKQ
jgi:hypothetical protein